MNAQMNRVLRQMADKIDETVAEEKKMVFGKLVDVDKAKRPMGDKAKAKKIAALKKKGMAQMKTTASGRSGGPAKTAMDKLRSRSKTLGLRK